MLRIMHSTRFPLVGLIVQSYFRSFLCLFLFICGVSYLFRVVSLNLHRFLLLWFIHAPPRLNIFSILLGGLIFLWDSPTFSLKQSIFVTLKYFSTTNLNNLLNLLHNLSPSNKGSSQKYVSLLLPSFLNNFSINLIPLKTIVQVLYILLF